MSTMTKPALLSIYWHEARYAFIEVWRTPGFTLPTLIFPVVFYLFFGIIFTFGGGSWQQSTYLVATYGTFGIIGPALFGFGALVASERDQGWLLLKQASPMPITAYFAAKIFMSMVFSAVVIGLLYTLAYFGGGVRLAAWQWLAMAGLLMVGTLPFCALGLMVGTFARASSANAVVNLIYLPMGLLSGLWMPIVIFPEFLKAAAHVFPAYHLSQLVLGVVDLDLGQPVLLHVLVLLGQTGLFLSLAIIGFRKKC